MLFLLFGDMTEDGSITAEQMEYCSARTDGGDEQMVSDRGR